MKSVLLALLVKTVLLVSGAISAPSDRLDLKGMLVL